MKTGIPRAPGKSRRAGMTNQENTDGDTTDQEELLPRSLVKDKIGFASSSYEVELLG
jgi:hypothetical protein